MNEFSIIDRYLRDFEIEENREEIRLHFKAFLEKKGVLISKTSIWRFVCDLCRKLSNVNTQKEIKDFQLKIFILNNYYVDGDKINIEEINNVDLTTIFNKNNIYDKISVKEKASLFQSWIDFLNDTVKTNIKIVRLIAILSDFEIKDSLTYEITQPSCQVAYGTIEITNPTGSEYSYKLDDNVQPDVIFNNVKPGKYQLCVIDKNGNTSNPVTITIDQQPPTPIKPVITIIQPTYTVPAGSIRIDTPAEDGCTYSIDGIQYTKSREFKDLNPGVYKISVKNSHGCVSEEVQAEIIKQPVITYKITQPSCQVPYGAIEVTNPTGTEYSYKLDDNVQPDVIFNNVKPGKYQLCVIDKNGNTSNPETITIDQQPPTPIKPVITIIQPTYTVPAGSIRIDMPAEEGYTYSIDGLQYTKSREFKGLNPGVYNISVRNSYGCVSEEVQAEIKNQPVPVIQTIQPKWCHIRGVIDVTQPSDPQYTYSIDDSNYQQEPKFKKVKPGKYNVTVKANGMKSLATVAEIKPYKILLLIASIIAVFIFIIAVALLLLGALSKKNPQKFEVFKHYVFSGKMGDISDITEVIPTDSSLTFTYTTAGIGPHEWGYKYLDNGQVNKNPAGFGGIAGLYPQDNWCNQDGGRDLRKFSNKITWQAKFESPDTNIQELFAVFKIGNIKWHFSNKSKVPCDERYQDSMDDLSLGMKELTREWQNFEYDLSAVDKSEFKKVVGGFITVVPLVENHIVPDSINPKTFTIYLKNVYYWGK